LTLGNPADGPVSSLPIAAAARRSAFGRADAATATNPLTHHDILRLVEPFTRQGRRVDLAASDRLERSLVFRPILHGQDTPNCGGVSEVLRLDNPSHEYYRLTRTLVPESGPPATLVAAGSDPRELLARIESVPPQRQFQRVADVLIARSYKFGAAGGAQSLMVLMSAEARLSGLTLTLDADTGGGYPAEIALQPQENGVQDLPDDVLAALGWDWRVINRRGTGWISTLRVPRREPARSHRIEVLLEQTVAHLARTLAEPPHAFHDRMAAARWRVVFRRLIPLLSCAALIAGTAALSYVDIPQDSMLLMLIFNFPPLLMIAVFSLRELPRFEIPPLPRRSTAASWLPAEAAATPDRHA
jgi:hypothetical protein